MRMLKFPEYTFVTQVWLPKEHTTAFILRNKKTNEYYVDIEGEKLEKFRNYNDAILYARTRTERLKKVI